MLTASGGSRLVVIWKGLLSEHVIGWFSGQREYQVWLSRVPNSK